MLAYGDIQRTPEQKALDAAMYETTAAIVLARGQCMEEACVRVMQLGYEPKDCLIEHHAPTAHTLGDCTQRDFLKWAERDVLKVRGVPAFEVRVSFDGQRFNISGHVLTWPAPRAPEHAPALAGGREA